MRSSITALSIVLLAGIGIMSSKAAAPKPESPVGELLTEAKRLAKNGDYRDAATIYRRVALERPANENELAEALRLGVQAIWNYAGTAEADSFRSAVVQRHPENRRVLSVAAETLIQSSSYGSIVDGQFQRDTWNGTRVNVGEADRIQAIQWLANAVERDRVAGDTSRDAVRALETLKQAILSRRTGNQTWKLLELTDPQVVPDYNDPDAHPEVARQLGWPVDGNNDPIAFREPASWADATNDGERYRWVAKEIIRLRPGRRDAETIAFADFLRSHLGVQSIGHIGGDDDSGVADDLLSLRTLKNNETIARLTTGVRRLTLPDDLNFVAFYDSIENDRRRLDRLSTIFLDRQQYAKAEKLLRSFTERGTDGGSLGERYRQITGNLGQLQPFESQAAGEPVVVNYRFRNGTRVDFEAQKIDVDRLVADWKESLRGKKKGVEAAFQNLGWFLTQNRPDLESGIQYLSETTFEWSVDLQPRDGHFDKTEEIKTPLTEGGAYLVTASMADGNVSRVVVWLDQLAIVKKRMSTENVAASYELVYVADARTGQPIANARIDLFSVRGGNRPQQIETQEQTHQTDDDGFATFALPERYQCLLTVTAPDGRSAFLNPERIWNRGRFRRDQFSRTKGYGVTDRPIYRPGHTVHSHGWVREARYDLGDVSTYAGKTASLLVRDPQGNDVVTKSVVLDEFGGAGLDWEIPSDAKLGSYSLRFEIGDRGFGVGSFRVEEYRKPDFEVSIDQPTGAVKLGESFDITVRANYYAGGPVSQGTVAIKIERTTYSDTYYPIQPWDWLYGNGYGWKWFDGYGGHRFNPWWNRSGPPEMVLQQDVELAADGTATVSVDTAIAKLLYGGESQKYQVTAEVTDVSRRVIAASGSVVAASKPFEVSVWTRRGFVETGEKIPFQVTARRIGGGPVEGAVQARLIRLTRSASELVETEVAVVAGTTAEGHFDAAFEVTTAGLYRVEADVTDGNDRELGTHEFLARGKTIEVVSDQALTLTADKREYNVGDVAKLLITTTAPGTQALVFERPESGHYVNRGTRKMETAAELIEIPITQADMPNIFVEVVAVVNGEVETAVVELFVPPTSRALDVKVEASQAEVGPGEQVELKILATDANGEPHVGAVAVSVYDRSLDAISGGAGAGDIRSTFWSWRRSHHVNHTHSLARVEREALKDRETRLEFLGRFGDISDVLSSETSGPFGGGGGFGIGAMQSPSRRSGGLPMPSSAPMEADLAMDDAFVEGAPMARKAKGVEVADKNAASEPVAVRESFADTAFWTAVARTDADGVATLTVSMPENLTAWSANAWVVAPGTRVGHGSTGIVTTKDLLVRVIAPRFLVQTDEVVLSGVVQNQSDQEVSATVDLALDGGVLELADGTPQTIQVPANGTARVDFVAHATGEGTAGLTLTARSPLGDDAMRITLPVKIHGYLRTESWAGVLREETSSRIEFVVPAERRPKQSLVSVRISPTVAGAIVESLPYLIEYPYGCTEQTLNKFLPAAITRKILTDLDVSLEEVSTFTSKLDPNVPDVNRKQAGSPVLSDETLDDVVKTGVDRLVEMQLSDGGWGWFSGYNEHSYPHTTAVVVRGLQRAISANTEMPNSVVPKGVAWLDRYRTQQLMYLSNYDADMKNVRRKASADHLDAMIEMVLVDAGQPNARMQNYLFRDRLKLSPMGLAMVGLAFAPQPESNEFRTVVSNLEQFFVGDSENGTAYLETPNRFGYWWWYGDDVEANAYALKLFCRAMPADPRVSGLARYLLNNRRNASYWKSTRDTAIAVEALGEYLSVTRELSPDVTLEVVIDGESKRQVHVTRENLFGFDGCVEITGKDVGAGPHTIELKRSGDGPLYYAVQSTNFSLENFIPKAGLELKTERRYWKLTPRDQTTTVAGSRGQAVDITIEAFDRTPLAQNEAIESGTLVEVELLVDSKNDYEYLLLEDRKPAGFEAVEGLSGYRPGFSGAYVEFRDDRVAMFFRSIQRGRTSVKYRVRAEQPGRFSALPARIEAMYAPTLVGNSDEQKVGVSEIGGQ